MLSKNHYIIVLNYPCTDGKTRIFLQYLCGDYKKTYTYKDQRLSSPNGLYNVRSYHFSSIRECIGYLKTFYKLQRSNEIVDMLNHCGLWNPNYYINYRTGYYFQIIGMHQKGNPLCLPLF